MLDNPYAMAIDRWRKIALLPVASLLVYFCQPPASARAAPTDSTAYATMDGVRIYYETHGSPRDTLVLIHGWACDHTFWRSQVAAFARQRQVIVLDLPGHGLSDKPRIDYTSHLFAKAVNAVITAAHVQRVTLVGHSMGTIVSREFIARYPDKVKGLIIVDEILFSKPVTPAALQERNVKFRERVARFNNPDYKNYAGRMIDEIFTEETAGPLRQEIKARMLSTPQHVMASAWHGIGDPANLRETPVSIPVLAIYAHYQNRPPQMYENFVRRLFPNLDYREWMGVDHFLMMERPEEFNAVVLEFLKNHHL